MEIRGNRARGSALVDRGRGFVKANSAMVEGCRDRVTDASPDRRIFGNGCIDTESQRRLSGIDHSFHRVVVDRTLVR